MKPIEKIALTLLALAGLNKCTGCDNIHNAQDEVAEYEFQTLNKYLEFSQKPVASVLDIALKKSSISRSDDCVLGFTEDDVKFLESLDKEGLIQLKLEIAEAWGFKDDQIIEDILDDAYFEIAQSLEAQEMVKLNDFMIQYINMPEGCVSLENLNIFKEGENSKSFDNAVISAATLIDKFGRVFYDSNVNSRGSEGECRKIFAMRITITCIGSMAGMLLPGPGWAVVAAAVCDAASAAADYANCLG